jgi:hypothetical protein
LSTASYNPPVAADGLEIVAVSQEPGARLRGHFRVRDQGERHLEIVGWALGDAVAATEVVVIADGSVAGSAPVAVERADVAEKYPDEPAAATCGFRLELVGEGNGQSRLELFAVLEDETREPLGRILCRSRS